jgi:hypothetical protein
VQHPNPDGSYSSPVRPFNEGLAAVKTDDGWGFIDTTGKLVIEPQFDNVGSFQDGLAFVSILGKEAYITKSGAFVVDPMPGVSIKELRRGNFTDINAFFAAFQRAVGTKDMRVVAEFVNFPFDQQMAMMTKDEFVANYKMGNDEIRIVTETPAPTRYQGDLGYGVNNAAFAMRFKKNREGYWKWASIYYGE